MIKGLHMNNKLRITLCMSLSLSLSLSLCFSSAFAANTYTTTGSNIEKITAYSSEESIFPNAKSLVQVRTSSEMNWTAGGCDSYNIFIRGSDSHLIELVNLAKIHNKQVQFYADTEMPKVDGSFCLLRAVSLL